MPSDLLVPAFVITLVANAILIAVAMRGLLPGRSLDARRRAPTAPRPGSGPGPTRSTEPAPETAAPNPAAESANATAERRLAATEAGESEEPRAGAD